MNELDALESAAREADINSGRPVAGSEGSASPSEGGSGTRSGERQEPAPVPGGNSDGDAPKGKQQEPKASAPKEGERPKSQFQIAKESRKEREKSRADADREFRRARKIQEEYQERLAALEREREASQPGPEDFIRHADELEQQGDNNGAQQARQQAQQLHWQRVQKQTLDQNLRIWNDECQGISKVDPEFADENSPLGQRIHEMLKDKDIGPKIRSSPYGIHFAYARAKAEQYASYLQVALNQLKQLKEENAELKKRFGSPVSSPKSPVSKSFTNMSRDEQMQEMMREAAKLDASRSGS